MVVRNRYRKTKRRGSGMTPRTPKSRRPSSLPRKSSTKTPRSRSGSSKKRYCNKIFKRRSGTSKVPEPIMSTPRSRFHSPRAGSTSKKMMFKPRTMSKTPISSRPSSIPKKTPISSQKTSKNLLLFLSLELLEEVRVQKHQPMLDRVHPLEKDHPVIKVD